MANDQISLDEYLKQLNTRVEDLKVSEQINFGQMGLTPIEPLDYTYTSGGSLHSGYGAVPNVTIGSTTHTSATGINVSSPVWTTTTSPYTITAPNTQPSLHVGPSGKNPSPR